MLLRAVSADGSGDGRLAGLINQVSTDCKHVITVLLYCHHSVCACVESVVDNILNIDGSGQIVKQRNSVPRLLFEGERHAPSSDGHDG